MNATAAAEIATIAAINQAVVSNPSPHVLVLLRFLKEGHQTAYAQLTAVGSAVACVPPMVCSRPLPPPAAADFLKSLRDLEDSWSTSYRAAAAKHDGLSKEVLGILGQHSETRAQILTAHIAVNQNDTTDLQRLPLPVASYLANAESRACMRCFVDRPGKQPAIVRNDPHTYVCSACHDEARLAFPLEIQVLIDKWPDELRNSRVVEKSLSEPSKAKARKEVLPALAGLVSKPASQINIKPIPRQTPAARSHAVDAPTVPELHLDAASPSERTYLEEMFDPRKMRRHW